MINCFCKEFTLRTGTKYWVLLNNITDTHLDFMVFDLDNLLWAQTSIPRGDWILDTTEGLEQVSLEIFDFWYSSVKDNAAIHQNTILHKRKDEQ